MDQDTEKVLSTLAYPIPAVLGLILALVAKSQNAKFHGWQAFFWGIGLFLLNILIGWIPFFGGLFFTVIFIIWLVFSLIFAVKAWKGESFEVPLAGKLAKRVLK
ncbi:DUF4870 domain-containing protein [Candidatus Woesearchaeota archaeon]|nr:DUF4870 domain-containing protein [Candidatus Woesearchaeota archaeon]